MRSMEEIKKMNKVEIPPKQETIQQAIMLNYVLMSQEQMEQIIRWNKIATQNVSDIKHSLQIDKIDMDRMERNLQEKLTQTVRLEIIDKMNDMINKEKNYNRQNLIFKMKAVAIGILVGTIIGVIINLLH